MKNIETTEVESFSVKLKVSLSLWENSFFLKIE